MCYSQVRFNLGGRAEVCRDENGRWFCLHFMNVNSIQQELTVPNNVPLMKLPWGFFGERGGRVFNGLELTGPNNLSLIEFPWGCFGGRGGRVCNACIRILACLNNFFVGVIPPLTSCYDHFS